MGSTQKKTPIMEIIKHFIQRKMINAAKKFARNRPEPMHSGFQVFQLANHVSHPA